MIGRQAAAALALTALGAVAAAVVLDRSRIKLTDALMGAYNAGFDAGTHQDDGGWTAAAAWAAPTGGRRIDLPDGRAYVRLHTAAPWTSDRTTEE